jgi:hypothetical protein
MSELPFIVAEVSKNWISGTEAKPGSGLLAEQFQRVIETNRKRGYMLYQFQVGRLMVADDEMNETIIAVFQRHE